MTRRLLPSVTATLRHSGHPEHATVELELRNAGGTEVAFTLTPNDFAGTEQTVWVGGGDPTRLTWRTDDGRYDVTVTAGTGTRFVRRYAGTVHAGSAVAGVGPGAGCGPGPSHSRRYVHSSGRSCIANFSDRHRGTRPGGVSGVAAWRIPPPGRHGPAATSAAPR
ncbi:phospholipase domain-containing protein [Streptomyces sp. NPDC047079]|uniref:phospholipase domain-containing protein n=1 Tax=Streptomyces sp. NPDC047079 TaxID=3154607 RepID=UPI0033F55483